MLILWDRKLANLLEGVVLLVPISDRLSYSTNLKTLYQHLLYKSINYLFALNNARSNSPNFKWLSNSPVNGKKKTRLSEESLRSLPTWDQIFVCWIQGGRHV